MGQKVNSNIVRLGFLHTWNSRWFSQNKKQYQKMLYQDIQIRKILMERLRSASISRIEIERSIRQVTITLHVARPGVVIGRGGEGLESLKKQIDQFYKTSGESMKIELRVEGIKKPDMEPFLVAHSIADQMAKRIPHKRAVNQAMRRAMESGAKGIQIVLSGRIAGAEIGRREKYKDGTVPMSTLRENVRYAQVPSLTKSGYVGVKVWICD